MRFTIGCMILLLGLTVPSWMGLCMMVCFALYPSVWFVLGKRGVGLNSGLNKIWELESDFVKYHSIARNV